MGTMMSTRVRGRWLAALVFLAAALGTGAASAEVRVSDAGGGQLRVEARGATVRQVLDALGAAQPLQVHTTDALSRTVTGTYTGSLARVLSRVLDGYNHVVHTTAAGLEIEVFGTATGARATTAIANTVTMVPNNNNRVSSNIDADEEAAANAMSRPSVVNAPAPPVRAAPVALTGSVQHPGAPRVSGNVDLDEETSR